MREPLPSVQLFLFSLTQFPGSALQPYFIILFYFILFLKFFIVIQLQLYAFSPHPSTQPQLMVYLHSGILCSREKEGASTLCNSMDGTGEHHAK